MDLPNKPTTWLHPLHRKEPHRHTRSTNLPTSATAASPLPHRTTTITITTISNSNNHLVGLLALSPPTQTHRHRTITILVAFHRTTRWPHMVIMTRVKGQGHMARMMMGGQSCTMMKVTSRGSVKGTGRGGTARKKVKGPGTEMTVTGPGCHFMKSTWRDRQDHRIRESHNEISMTIEVHQGKIQTHERLTESYLLGQNAQCLYEFLLSC